MPRKLINTLKVFAAEFSQGVNSLFQNEKREDGTSETNLSGTENTTKTEALRKKSRAPGWDAKVIAQIAKKHFGGLQGLFEHHGWPERGNKMMPNVQRRVAEDYGSVENFAKSFGYAE